jgi:hypothetical protein
MRHIGSRQGEDGYFYLRNVEGHKEFQIWFQTAGEHMVGQANLFIGSDNDWWRLQRFYDTGWFVMFNGALADATEPDHVPLPAHWDVN